MSTEKSVAVPERRRRWREMRIRGRKTNDARPIRRKKRLVIIVIIRAFKSSETSFDVSALGGHGWWWL